MKPNKIKEKEHSKLWKDIESVVRFHCRYCGRLRGQEDYHPLNKCEYDVQEQVLAIVEIFNQQKKEIRKKIKKIKKSYNESKVYKTSEEIVIDFILKEL